jgi:ABC-type branched-subunit amino acid transport system permease subunit
MSAPQALDPVAVAVVIAATVFAPDVAAVVGPYAVIVLAAAIGAAWALSREQPTTRWRALYFFMRLIGTAVCVTVALATTAEQFFGGGIRSTVMLAPIALLVGGIGDDWPAVGKWALGLLQRAIEAFAGRGRSGQ